MRFLGCTIILLVAWLGMPIHAQVTSTDSSRIWSSKPNLKPVIELSFGQAQMFIRTSDRLNLTSTEAEVLPTSSALLLGEWLATKHWHCITLFNLPVGSQKIVLNNGTVSEERVSPYLGIGPIWEPTRWVVLQDRISVAAQLTAVGGIVFRASGKMLPAPVTGGRFHLATPDGFTMYLGGTATIGIPAFSLLYGVGHRF